MVYDYKLHLAIITPRACQWEQSVARKSVAPDLYIALIHSSVTDTTSSPFANSTILLVTADSKVKNGTY